MLLYTLKNEDDWFETDVPDIDFYRNFKSQEQKFKAGFANNYPKIVKSKYNVAHR